MKAHMKIKFLFDIGHPAHVHLFRNLIKRLIENGHDVVVGTRDKEITNQLLDHYKIEYISLSKPSTGKLGMIRELLVRDWKLLKLHKKHQFNFAIGTSVSIGHLSFLSTKKLLSFNFNEDDDATVPLYAWIAYPFCSKIINPDCVEFNRWKKKRVLVNSYHELAYLHPNNFTPDPSILKKYNLTEKGYVIARFSALEAHHDSDAEGISRELWGRIEAELNQRGLQIIKSVEKEKSHSIDLWDMHHILAFAKIIISDSQTMTIEGAVLGVPAVRVNTFFGLSTVIKELEEKYELALGFHPDEEEQAFSQIKALLSDDTLDEKWANKKDTFLRDKIDLNNWMNEFLDKQTDEIAQV